MGPIASNIPHVVLAGILIKVGTDIIDWDYLKRVHISPAPGVVIMFTVLIITVFVDLIVAVAAGMTMASMLYLKRHSDMQLSKINIRRSADEESPLSAEEADIFNGSTGRLLLFHIGGPMSFGAAKGMVKLLAYQQDYQVLVLDMSDVPSLDYTASRGIKDMVNNTLDAGRKVVVALPPGEPCAMLDRENILDALPMHYRHIGRLSALRFANRLLKE
jgi:SulP family sulfate permease